MEQKKHKAGVRLHFPRAKVQLLREQGPPFSLRPPGPLSPESPLGGRDTDGPAHLIESTALLLWAGILAPTR